MNPYIGIFAIAALVSFIVIGILALIYEWPYILLAILQSTIAVLSLFTNEVVIGAKVALFVILACVFVRLGVWFYSVKAVFKMDAWTIQTWNVSLWAMMGMMWIIGFSLQCEQHNVWAFVIYAIMVIVFLAVQEYSLWGGTPKWAWLKLIWTPQKGFAGGTFGDFAGAVGILAGVGAYQLANANQGWYWLGQFGGFLCVLIGVSQFQMWLEENADASIWNALASMAVGSFTLLALYSSAGAMLLYNLTLNIIQMVFISFLAVTVSLAYIARQLNRRPKPDKSPGHRPYTIFFFMPLTILLIGAPLFILGFRMSSTNIPGVVSMIFGILATAVGALMELMSFWKAKEPFLTGGAFKRMKENGHEVYYINNWEDPIKLIRGLDMIIGYLGLLALVPWVASDQVTYTAGQWFVFCGAIALMTQASLGGIAIAAHQVAYSHYHPAPVLRRSKSEPLS